MFSINLKYNKNIALHAIYTAVIIILLFVLLGNIYSRNSDRARGVAFEWYISRSGLIYYKTDRKFPLSGDGVDIYLYTLKANAEENYARKYLNDMYDSMSFFERFKIHAFGYRSSELSKLKVYMDKLRRDDPMTAISQGPSIPFRS